MSVRVRVDYEPHGMNESLIVVGVCGYFSLGLILIDYVYR